MTYQHKKPETISPKRKTDQPSLETKPHLPPLGPIPFRRMADQIAAALRDSITTGKLPPNMHLRELDIAREMQTSRVPVREALMQLEREGLVVRLANRGTFVAEITDKMVREVSTLRGILEGFAVSEAVRRLTARDFEELESLTREMRDAAESGDFARVLECDYGFHRYLVHLPGHDLLEETWKTTDGKIRVYLSATNQMHLDLQSIARSHRVLLDALRTRDPEKARRATMKHIEEALDLVITRFSNPNTR
jgi:DNA-binding GntR family transcriptional regulator